MRPWWEADSPQAAPRSARAAPQAEAELQTTVSAAADATDSTSALQPVPHHTSTTAAQPPADSCAVDAAGSLPRQAAGLSLSDGDSVTHSHLPNIPMQDFEPEAACSSSPVDVQQPVRDALHRPPALATDGQLHEPPAGSPSAVPDSRASQEQHLKRFLPRSPTLPSAQKAEATAGECRQPDAAAHPAADSAAEERQQEAAAQTAGMAATPGERQRQRDRRQQFDTYAMDYYAKDGGAWSSYYAPKPSGSAAGKLAALRAGAQRV